jgi:hypothetical protein
MDRVKKQALIQRSLGLRHKLKVHDSLKAPETHDELSVMMMARWDLEDELRAIEEVLAGERQKAVASKRSQIEREEIGPTDEEGAPLAKKKGKKP